MVTPESRSVEERLAEVFDLVRGLTRRVDQISERLETLRVGAPAQPPAAAAQPPGSSVDSAGATMSWVGQSRVLQRIAMVSFVLVVALVLRTLTDSQSIGIGVGVVLGIVYSALLVALGAWRLARRGHGQRVLPACGAVLLCAVALEAHRKFQLMSADTVNWILIADLLIVGAIGLWFRMGSIVAVAALVPGLSALTVGFPNLQFPLAAALFLLANMAAYLAFRFARTQWLPWATFAVTLFFWLLWTLKARAHLLTPDPVPAAGLGLPWFLPWLGMFALLYAGTAVRRAAVAPRGPGVFHAFLPTGNALWAYPAGAAVVGPLSSGLAGLGAVALGAAAAHLAFAAWLWRRLREPAAGITAFTLAGVALFALAVTNLVDSLPLEVSVLAAAALGLALFASRCGSPSLRLCAMLLQIVVCSSALLGDLYAVPSAALWSSVSPAFAVAALSGWQYLHDRKHPPPPGSWFARLDPGRHASVPLLWTAAVASFGGLRLLLDRTLTLLGSATPDAFQCGQSVILNGASIAMLLWGMRTGNRQVLFTAVLVAVAGGFKVFGSDLLSASGLPLVLAVLSFGIAAAVGSIVLGRLQRVGAAPPSG